MKHCLAAISIAAVLLSCAREEILPETPEAPKDVTGELTDNYVSGEVRVYLSEELTAMVEEAAESGTIVTKSSSMNNALSELGITEMTRLFPHAGEFEGRTRREGLHRWYVVKYSREIPVTKAQMSLEQVEGIDIFEPVIPVKINDFNDQYFSDLWGMYNQTKPGVDINVRSVWNEYTTGNPNVIVSVVDDGIDLYHEDLADNCASSNHFNFVNNNEYIIPGDHGTHVAGTIAAVGNNGKGVVGVAGGNKVKGQKGVKLLSSQIFTSEKSAGGAAAIKWGADHGAVISQNSWGYVFDRDGNGKIEGEEYTAAMNTKISSSDKSAVDYFIKYAGCDDYGNQLPDSPMKGGVVFFAAGNDAIPMGAPAEYEKVIAVGAIASDGKRASYSNYGDWVDICAPGSGILSTFPNNQYEAISGTSMACPHVSGVAALIVSYFGGAGFTNEMLKEKLLNSSNKSVISPHYLIGGLVDAYGAFVYGNDKAPSEVVDLEVSARGNNIDLSWTVPSDEDGKAAYGFLIVYSEDKTKLEAATPRSLQDVFYTTCAPECAAGQKAQFSVTRLDFETQYYVKMYAYSYGRNYSAATEVFEPHTTENHAPEVTVGYDGEISLMSSETLKIPVLISDPDGHEVNVTHEKASEAETLMLNPDGSWIFTIKGSAAEIGTYVSKITATDEYGMSVEYQIIYAIKENSAPEKIKDIENILLTAKGKEFNLDMTEYVTDPDKEQLKYDVELSNATVAHLNPKGNTIYGTALSYGSVDVTITAKDARNEKVVFTFKLTVKDPSKPLSVYPNPVRDYVNIATLDMAETTIRICSSTGQVVHEETSQVSGLEPATIDMRDCAPGVYSVAVTFDGKEYKQSIVKL